MLYADADNPSGASRQLPLHRGAFWCGRGKAIHGKGPRLQAVAGLLRKMDQCTFKIIVAKEK